eukprot:2668312-Amphidinium_carterae.1
MRHSSGIQLLTMVIQMVPTIANWQPESTEQWNYIDYSQGAGARHEHQQYADQQLVQHIGLFGVCVSGPPSINNVSAAQQNKRIQLNAQSPRHLRDFWAVIIDTGAAIS